MNSTRIPATVRHPIQTDDEITLGINIKGQGPAFETVFPLLMKVGIKFGAR